MRILRKVLIVAALAVVCYIASVSVLTNLKANGNSDLFYDENPYDLVIRHVMIMDGTAHTERYRGDIAIYDGKIVDVGVVNSTAAPVFDAGGLTVIPASVLFTGNDDALQHAFSTSYPRFRPENIYLQDETYGSNNLEQAAEDLELPVAEAHEALKKSLGPQAKAYIVYLPEQTETTTMEEYLARLTSYRANYSGRTGQGVINEGADANLHFFLSGDYDDDKLIELFKKGKMPDPLFTMTEGKFVK